MLLDLLLLFGFSEGPPVVVGPPAIITLSGLAYVELAAAGGARVELAAAGTAPVELAAAATVKLTEVQ